MMLDGAEECQLSGLIGELVPFSSADRHVGIVERCAKQAAGGLPVVVDGDDAGKLSIDLCRDDPAQASNT
jgi:hypothetical protein